MRIFRFVLFVLGVTGPFFVQSLHSQVYTFPHERPRMACMEYLPATVRDQLGYAACDPGRIIGMGGVGVGYPGTGVSRKVIVAGTTAGGAAIGSAWGWKGAAIGAGGGFAAGMIATRGRGQDNGRQVDCSKRKLNRKEQEACAAVAAQEQKAAQQMAAQQVQQAQQSEAERLAQTYYNRTGRPIDIRDGAGNLVADVPNGGSVELPENHFGYRAYMRLPAAPGKTAFREADKRRAKNGSGFVFEAPLTGAEGDI